MVYIYTSVQHEEAGGMSSPGKKPWERLLEALLAHVKCWKEKQAYGAEEKLPI